MEATRKLPRLRKSLTFLLPDGWRGDVVDVSAVGMRIQSLVLLPKGVSLEGTLVFPEGESIKLKGNVIWSRAADHESLVPAEMGVELFDVPDSYLQAVAELFAE